ncbi:hypothetical protein ZIOFF_071390 [Zingiber officinale]|uniref:Uncharacterized protein n=1 Tax=Zingiber officinale TaxID=94328 RepID=A0A8J5ENL8_ZINOF|nr:hypothetical protein ZIOFF_071390 [Zingiber officinale]
MRKSCLDKRCVIGGIPHGKKDQAIRGIQAKKNSIKKWDSSIKYVNNAAIGGIASNTQLLDSSKQAMQPVSSSGLANAIVETYELAEDCINTNYYGPKRVTEAFIPLL